MRETTRAPETAGPVQKIKDLCPERRRLTVTANGVPGNQEAAHLVPVVRDPRLRARPAAWEVLPVPGTPGSPANPPHQAWSWLAAVSALTFGVRERLEDERW